MNKYYTISKQNYITLVAWVYFYLTMRNKKKSEKENENKKVVGSTDDFAYIIRDPANIGVNAFERIGPGLMRKASREVNLFAKKRIKQFIQKRRREVERVTSIILKTP